MNGTHTVARSDTEYLNDIVRSKDPRVPDTVIQKLSPTPTNDANDPLNWPLWLKVSILTQTSVLAALGGLNTATINPALAQLGKEFGITTVRASYQTTVCIALNGVAPYIWLPLANKFGRRPIYLFTTLLGFGSILACAYARTFAELLVARVFNGLFPVAFALGATTVTDLFFYHQRGRAMGYFTIIMTTGSHLAPIVGGLIGQYLGWRWIFKFAAIVDGVVFLICCFCLPETMYVRPPGLALLANNRVRDAGNDKEHRGISQYEKDEALAKTFSPVSPVNTSEVRGKPRFTRSMYASRLKLMLPSTIRRQLPPYNPLKFLIATATLVPLPAVILPALYYATQYGFASILPAVTAAAIYSEAYGWRPLQIGLTYGISLTVGGILGEFCAGWIVDLIVVRAQRRRQQLDLPGQPPPEVRFKAIWPGAILVPISLIIYGFALRYHKTVPWPAPIFVVGVSCFGLQIITTTTYTYAIDCYKERSGEVAQVFNFVRQEIGMTFAFYAVNLGHRIGFQWLFFFYAACGCLAFIGILLLMWRGERWRGVQ